jgi:hypothetical protein
MNKDENLQKSKKPTKKINELADACGSGNVECCWSILYVYMLIILCIIVQISHPKEGRRPRRYHQ